MGRRTRSKCPTCFDAGYLGGFLTPIECWIQIDPNPHHPSSNTIQGESQPKATSGRLIAYPPVKPKDIIVESNNNRWRVVTVNRTERLRASVHQELTLREINRGDIEYALPVTLDDLENTEFAAERNFTNPQHTGDNVVLPVVTTASTEEFVQNNREQSFQYTVLSDGDSFDISIPIAMVDTTYVVSATISYIPVGGALALLQASNLGRTRTQFTLEASGNLSAGTIIDVIVRDRD